LQEFLQQHPGIREEFSENPNGFMRQEQRFDRREDSRDRDGDTTHAQLGRMDSFWTAIPKLPNNCERIPGSSRTTSSPKTIRRCRISYSTIPEFAKSSPRIQTLSCGRSSVSTGVEDGREAADGDTTRAQLGRMDQFLDSHPEIAEQLRKDPGLMKSDEFTKSHPALQEFLQQHPGIREEVSENPKRLHAAGTALRPA